jgi:hypothetical protein
MRRMGYQCSTSLRNSFPDLVDKLLSRGREQIVADREGVRMELVRCLSEWPPPKWADVERRTGRTAATLSESAPDEYRAVQKHMREYATDAMAQRRRELFDEVVGIVRRNLENGRVTTYGERLWGLLSSRSSANWITLWDALKAARTVVGLLK